MAEVWPSRASSSRMRPWRVRMSAWAALGVVAQMSGGRGGSAHFIDGGIPRRRSSRKLVSQGGAERLLKTIGLDARAPPCHAARNTGGSR